MTDMLLQCLSSQDLSWLRSAGKLVKLPAGKPLSHLPQAFESVYLIINGRCTIAPDRLEHSERNPLAKFLMEISSGNMLGLFLDQAFDLKQIYAIDEVCLWAIPQATFHQKIKDDTSFAAHIYQANVLMVIHQFRSLEQQNRSQFISEYQPKRTSVMVFSELQDSDLNWLINVGKVQSIAENAQLLQPGQPIDNLHFVLDGALAIQGSREARSPLLQAFGSDKTEALTTPGEELARLSRGDVLGEMSCVNASPLNFTVTAVRETKVISIPKWRVAAKLHHDVEFASRFYRMLMRLLQDQQASMIQQIASIESSIESSDDTEDRDFLNKISLAEARFAWMLKRIQTELGMGRELQW